jgi:hypothetical protein
MNSEVFMKRIIALLIILIIGSLPLSAQVIDASVTMQYEHLPSDEQDDLEGLSDKIEQYFDNYDWIEDEFEYDVEVNVQIIIETVQKKTHEKLYKAQFLISSTSGENFYDKSWDFPYEPAAPLSHTKGQFDPLTHLLDFYAYMVLAGELDTYGLLLGTPLYDKAQDIANQGILSQYARGWNQRTLDLQKITNIRTRPLREVKPDFFEALYFYDEENYEEAYKYGLLVLEGIKKVFGQQPNNRYLRMFFDAHYRRLAQLFAGKKPELESLVEMDSRHRETYREYMR